MRRTAALPLFLLAPLAQSQTYVEEFTDFSNEGAWELWWAPYNQHQTSGGNPGWYYELDNTLGSATCHFVEIFNTTWPCAYSGDYRALAVHTLGLDVNVQQGVYGGQWFLTLVSDNGTPADDSDDCRVTYASSQQPPLAPGWTSYDFDVPADSTTLPPGWVPEGPCGVTGHDIWNHVIQGVDQVVFRMDSDPTVFCAFTNWRLGVDNVRILAGIGGTNFCTSTVNSTGGAAVISAAGQASVAQNDLTLSAQPVPNQPGLFFFGPNQIQVPFGNGFLCVGGSQTRILPAAAASGQVATRVVDLTTFGIGPGVHNFQYWMRDPAAGGSFYNTSDGISITFVP